MDNCKFSELWQIYSDKDSRQHNQRPTQGTKSRIRELETELPPLLDSVAEHPQISFGTTSGVGVAILR